MTLKLILRRYAPPPDPRGLKIPGTCVNSCPVKCQRSKYEVTKQGKWIAYIFGRPAAALCDDCAKEWMESWVENGGKAEMMRGKSNP